MEKVLSDKEIDDMCNKAFDHRLVQWNLYVGVCATCYPVADPGNAKETIVQNPQPPHQMICKNQIKEVEELRTRLYNERAAIKQRNNPGMYR